MNRGLVALAASLQRSEHMPVEVYEGALGHLVICQEHTTPTKESYLRIMIDMDRADELCAAIKAVAAAAKARAEERQ